MSCFWLIAVIRHPTATFYERLLMSASLSVQQGQRLIIFR